MKSDTHFVVGGRRDQARRNRQRCHHIQRVDTERLRHLKHAINLRFRKAIVDRNVVGINVNALVIEFFLYRAELAERRSKPPLT